MSPEAAARSPFGRPGFVVAAAAVAGLVVLALVLVLTDDDGADAPSDADPVATAGPSGDPDAESVCGLEGEDLDGRLTSAPDVDAWEYQGTIAYPVSEEYGPADTTAAGVRSCFQRSPEGALLAAANALAQASDAELAPAWADYFLGVGEHRAEWIANAGGSASAEPSGVRLTVAGFRLLDYTGSTARVDLGVDAVTDGARSTNSYVYELVWQDGDWKLDAGAVQPLNHAVVPDLAGYVDWGE